MAAEMGNLRIETAGRAEEVTEELDHALEMKVEEQGAGEEGCEGTKGGLGSQEFLTQTADPSRKTLVDAHNGFNELSCLAML